MRQTARRWIVLGVVVLLAGVLFAAGIGWGLPSGEYDTLLVPSDAAVRSNARQSYLLSATGIQYELEHGPAMPKLGDKPVVLIGNEPGTKAQDDANRARILAAYRTESLDPDELPGFLSLLRISPTQGKFDPGQYAYGGLWIYPLRLVASVAQSLGWVKLGTSPEFYYEHPDQAARLYLVMRAYSVVWGLVAVAAVFEIVRRMTASIAMAGIAGLGTALLPAVIGLTHQGSPRIAASAMLLLSLLAAMNYLQHGRFKSMLLCSAGGAMAAAMYLPASAGLVLIPIAALARAGKSPDSSAGQAPDLESSARPRGHWLRDIVGGAPVAAVVYFAANPYVAIALAQGQGASLGLGPGPWSVDRLWPATILAMKFIVAGATWPIAIAGAIGALVLLFVPGQRDPREEFSEATSAQAALGADAALVWAMALASLIVFVTYAANRPATYALDSVTVDVALVVMAVSALSALCSSRWAAMLIGLGLIGGCAVFSGPVEGLLIREASSQNSRMAAGHALSGAAIAASQPARLKVLAVQGDPEGAWLPPVDLYGVKILLVPGDNPPDAAVEDYLWELPGSSDLTGLPEAGILPAARIGQLGIPASAGAVSGKKASSKR